MHIKADFKDDYFYITSDSDSLFGEDSSIIRVEKEEFESFIYENYTKELKEKARKYDEHIENKEMIKKEYERLEKEAEPLREKAKEARQKSLELINHLDKMISEAKKN